MVSQYFEFISTNRTLDRQLKDEIENDLDIYVELC